MGKHKHKNKNKGAASTEKQLSEADAAAGLMVVPKEPAAVMDKPKQEQQQPVKRPVEENPAHLTRKQKRQKLHEKNKWPQHPKITNPEQRAKAYLRVAGIDAISEEQEDLPKFPSAKEQEKALEEDDTEWRRFGRFLGGTDARTRHKAVQRLGQYLKAKSGYGLDGAELDSVAGLSELDLLKLWKGLWFTLYMADKVPVQDELAKQIAKLIWCVAGDEETDEFAARAYMQMVEKEEMEYEQEKEQKLLAEGDDECEDEDFKILETREVEMDSDKDEDESDDDHEEMEDDEVEEDEQEDEEEEKEEFKHIRGAQLSMLMVRTFFRTLVRDWGKMDKYRIDKFYTLIRYMVREIYRYMAQRQWSLGIIKMFNDVVTEEALTVPPNGVRYHLTDIALDELVLVANKSGAPPITEAIFLEVMEPYFAMTQLGFGDKHLQARAVEKVLEKFLMEYSVVSEKEDKKSILSDVHVGTVSQLIFDMAGDEEATLNIHRKSLYEMHKAYERQRKKTGTDIELPKAEQDDAGDDMDQEESALESKGFMAEDADANAEEVRANEPDAKQRKKDRKKKKKKEKKKKGNDKEPVESSNETPKTAAEAKADKKGGEKKTLEGAATVAKEGKKKKGKHKQQVESGEEMPGTEGEVKAEKKDVDKKNDESAFKGAMEDKKKKEHNKMPAESRKEKLDTAVMPDRKHEEKKKDKKKGREKQPTESRKETLETTADVKTGEKEKVKAASKAALDVTQHGSGDSGKKARKRKKKGRSKNESEEHSDEEVTISVSDQKKARQALKETDEPPSAAAVDSGRKKGKKDKNSTKKKGQDGERRTIKRRVSFDNHNVARSWKASMQGLKHLDPTQVASKSPEKSILLNKNKKSPLARAKSHSPKRKRAVDYF